MLVKEAQEFGKIGSRNSKMGTTDFSIDAFACITGSKLAKVPGTTCHKCYARHLQNLRPSVDKGWKDNLDKWNAADPDRWAQAMAFQIKRYNTDGYHRWFTSGDLQSVEMLDAIVQVARMTPEVQHWLPTQERAMLDAYEEAGGELPDNLTPRVSASKVDGKLPNYPNVSGVTRDKAKVTCPASQQGNACLDCKACWSKDVHSIIYPKH